MSHQVHNTSLTPEMATAFGTNNMSADKLKYLLERSKKGCKGMCHSTPKSTNYSDGRPGIKKRRNKRSR